MNSSRFSFYGVMPDFIVVLKKSMKNVKFEHKFS